MRAITSSDLSKFYTPPDADHLLTRRSSHASPQHPRNRRGGGLHHRRLHSCPARPPEEPQPHQGPVSGRLHPRLWHRQRHTHLPGAARVRHPGRRQRQDQAHDLRACHQREQGRAPRPLQDSAGVSDLQGGDVALTGRYLCWGMDEEWFNDGVFWSCRLFGVEDYLD